MQNLYPHDRLPSSPWVIASCLAEAFAVSAALISAQLAYEEKFFIDLWGFSLLAQAGLGIKYLCWSGLRRLSPTPAGLCGSSLACLSISMLTITLCASHLPGAAGNCPVTSLLILDALAFTPVLLLSRYYQLTERHYQDTLLHSTLRHHFFFNALNATVCLIASRPQAAENNLVNLASLFRKTLQQKPLITLTEEIETAKNYISVEQIRLEKRLVVEWRIPGEIASQVQVPAMLLQPLIENAIYHGIEPNKDGGVIYIGITPKQRCLWFEIRNSLAAKPVSPRSGNSMAHKIMRRRLIKSYGSDCQFECSCDANEYSVTFNLPK